MKSTLGLPLAGALLLAGAALSAGAYAQTSPTAPAPAPAAPPPAAAAPAAPASPGNASMEAKVTQRITQLHAQLKITAAEEPQWKTFADTMLENARKMDDDYKDRAGKFASLNAVENMQSYAQIAQEHAQDVQHLVDAFTPLYNAMPDAQKKVADQVFRNTAARRSGQ